MASPREILDAQARHWPVRVRNQWGQTGTLQNCGQFPWGFTVNIKFDNGNGFGGSPGDLTVLPPEEDYMEIVENLQWLVDEQIEGERNFNAPLLLSRLRERGFDVVQTKEED